MLSVGVVFLWMIGRRRVRTDRHTYKQECTARQGKKDLDGNNNGYFDIGEMNKYGVFERYMLLCISLYTCSIVKEIQYIKYEN